MISLRTVLVAYDFSGSSEAALRRAADLAPRSRIHLLHAYGGTLAAMGSYEGVVVPTSLWDAIRHGAEARLEGVRRAVAGRVAEATAEVSPLPPVEAILSAAEKIGPDLIALGTRGLTGLKHVLLGSVAERAVRLAGCPVLAVKEADRGGAPRRVMLPTDFSEQAEHALRIGLSLAEQYGAEVHLVHAFYLPIAPLAPYGLALPADLLHQGREESRKRLDEALRAARARGLAGRHHLTEGPAAPAIVRVAEEVKADLIVMGTHGYGGLQHALLGSIAERTLRLAPCPVLTVKRSEGGSNGSSA
jgi:nucleotide-binding universal stress UspA family protein